MSPVVMFAALRASAINSSPVGLGPEPEATDSEAVEAAEAGDREGLDAAQKKLAMFRGIHHLVIVLLILDMVYKPGL